MKKYILTLLTVLLPTLAMAQQMSIRVDSVGTLDKQLPDSIRFKVAELKVSGPLNGADLKLLNLIVTRTKVNKKVAGECLVTSIDLSEAGITEGKTGLKTENNMLPNSLFAGAKSLVRAVLPQNVLNISRNCFDNCTELKELNIPESVTTIEPYAFEDCAKLTTMDIPESVMEIGNNAFAGMERSSTSFQWMTEKDLDSVRSIPPRSRTARC